MTATNHVLTGVLIATYVHNPWVAIPVAVASHFVLDAIPHFDAPVPAGERGFKFFMWLMPDFALAASVLVSLFLMQPSGVWLMLVCGVGGASPDLMWLYYQILAKDKSQDNWPAIAKFHSKIQKYASPKMWPVELAWLLASGSLLVTRLY